MFRISVDRAIEVTKVIEKALKYIETVEIKGKNKVIHPKLKKDLARISNMWKKGLDLEGFEEWKTAK